MASPIKETPVLSTNEWDLFIAKVESDLADPSKRISRKEYDKSKEVFNKIMETADLGTL